MDLNVKTVESKGGAFYVTDSAGNEQKVDLGTLMMLLNIDRTGNLDNQIALKLEEISERNGRIKELTEFMSLLRTMKADGAGDTKEVTREVALNKSDLVRFPAYDTDPRLDPSFACGDGYHIVEIDGYFRMLPEEVRFDPTTNTMYETITENVAVDLTINGETKPLYGEGSWAEHFGITWSTLGEDAPTDSAEKDAWNQQFDANINNIKSQVDMLNNDSQMDNIKLQNIMEKRSNAFEMATKIMDTNNQTMESIIRNL